MNASKPRKLLLALIAVLLMGADESPEEVKQTFSLDDASKIVTMFGTVLTLVSLGIVIYQLKRTNRLTMATNAQELVRISAPFNLDLIKCEDLARYWVEGPDKYPTMSAIEQYRYKSVLIWWLIFHETIFRQRQEDVLDRPTYESWNTDLKLFCKHHRIAQHMKWIEGVYEKSFVEHLKTMVKPDEPVKTDEMTCPDRH